MNKSILLSLALAICSPAYATGLPSTLLPLPVEINTAEGVFQLPDTMAVSFDCRLSNDERNRLTRAIGRDLGAVTDATVQQSDISISLQEGKAESYVLSITPAGIHITGADPAGIFYGLQTLASLADGSRRINCITVRDYPQLPYRGMMIDISRHFHGKEFLLKQIEAMALLKLNNLHLHLTDAAGWRVAIDRYPLLTGYAAWRPQYRWQDWEADGCRYVQEGSPDAYGGYLTKSDVAEIVAYAADRYINVIPEIEMPGHSEEVIAAYPELNCLDAPHGSRELCPGNELTFDFIEHVLDEVMEMFPSRYIHIGGDEAGKRGWKQCPLCIRRLEEEGITDPADLQNYLVCRIGRYLSDHGRTLVGWDEIMEGNGQPDGAAVMVWRDPDTALKAAGAGHDVILTPSSHCYLDFYQDAPHTQPLAFGGYISSEKVYGYDPLPVTVPDSVRHHIIGLQGNLWCEMIPTPAHAEYMLYPRMLAMAEAAWTPRQSRSWEEFLPRMKAVTARMKAAGYNAFDPETETGNRPESLAPVDHLAMNATVIYNKPWWNKFVTNGGATINDGIRGGWSYIDHRWLGFFHRDEWSMDVTVDLGTPTAIGYIGADFMQLTKHDVWHPGRVMISVSDNGTDFATLHEISNHPEANDRPLFINCSWTGSVTARYVRYQAQSPTGIMFTDELIITPPPAR